MCLTVSTNTYMEACSYQLMSKIGIHKEILCETNSDGSIHKSNYIIGFNLF